MEDAMATTTPLALLLGPHGGSGAATCDTGDDALSAMAISLPPSLSLSLSLSLCAKISQHGGDAPQRPGCWALVAGPLTVRPRA